VGEPPALLTALSEQRRRFRNIKVAQILALRKFGYFDPETAEHVRHMAFFLAVRHAQAGKAVPSISFPAVFPTSLS